MQRRELLNRTALGFLGAASAPWWLAACFSQRESGGLRGPETEFRAAWEEARAVGKPLVVLVVPEEDHARWRDGLAWGVLLRSGGEELYRDLALTRVVCAPLADVRRNLPHATGLDGATALVVETDDPRPAARSIRVALPDPPQSEWDDPEETVEQEYRAWVAPLAASLRAHVQSGAAELERRAATARRLLPERDVERAEASIRSAEPPPGELADRAAALFLVAGAHEEAVVAAAHERLWQRPIDGAPWATSFGCGIEVEGGGDNGVACGMAHTPAVATRFLYFYSE
jgi:hypothetical protein